MRVQAGRDVVQPVAVQVDHAHVAAAGSLDVTCCGEGKLMERPFSIRGGCGRLLEPAAADEDVGAPVAVDVAGAEAVDDRAEAHRIGDAMHDPGRGGIRGIRLRIGERAPVECVYDLRLSVAVHVAQDRRLRNDARHHLVAVPSAILAPGIHVEHHRPHFGSQHVGPSVAGEIGRVGHHVQGVVRARVVGLTEVDLTARRVVGTPIVVRPGHHVQHAVLVDVGDGGIPGVVKFVEPLHGEVAGGLFG